MAARLTDSHARNARPKDKSYKLTDGNGLLLLVHPNGQKFWRYRYKLFGKENMYAIGSYPQLGLRQAREARDWARGLVKQGRHPAHQRQADKFAGVEAAANTFTAIANEWIEQKKDGWTPYYLKQVRTVLGNDVFPYIGKMPIQDIKPVHILKIIRQVADRDAKTVALLIRQWCSQVFCYAVATLRAEFDPCASLKGAVTRQKVQHKRALTPSEIVELKEKLDQDRGTPSVRLSIKLLLLTFVRPGELRQAMWAEFDLENDEWRIPAGRMKMRETHIVPLSKQAKALLLELKSISQERPQLFPNIRDPRRCMSMTTMNRYLERIGYAGKFSAHGFRATASTLLNEMGYRPDVIERQLAHRERNRVRASYNHATYMQERKAMMQEWADYVEVQRSGNVVPIRASVMRKTASIS